MKKTITLTFILFTISIINAQTKLIAHKSHSGKTKSFYKAMTNFNNKSSDFGIAPRTSKEELEEEILKIEKIKFVEACKQIDYDTITYVSDGLIKRTKKYKGVSKKNHFLYGKDSEVYKLLINTNDLEDLRLNNHLKGECFNQTIFVGFDKKEKELEKENTKKQSAPIIYKNNEPNSNLRYLILGIISLISILTAFFYKKIQLKKLN